MLKGMRRLGSTALTLVCFGLPLLAQRDTPDQAQLAAYRALGKAFYENPATENQAVEQFQTALALDPGCVREQVNYGLALLRAGETRRGIAELEKAKQLDPRVPHTWFNLGIAYKKQGDFDQALAQFRQMERLGFLKLRDPAPRFTGAQQ